MWLFFRIAVNDLVCSRGLTSIDDNAHEEDWDRTFNLNVKSHMWLMHAAKKHLDETEGAFITTASIAGVIPSGSSLVSHFGLRYPIRARVNTSQPYAVTKAAQIHLVKALAVMAAPKIRVNSVAPGLLLTVRSPINSEMPKSKET